MKRYLLFFPLLTLIPLISCKNPVESPYPITSDTKIESNKELPIQKDKKTNEKNTETKIKETPSGENKTEVDSPVKENHPAGENSSNVKNDEKLNIDAPSLSPYVPENSTPFNTTEEDFKKNLENARNEYALVLEASAYAMSMKSYKAESLDFEITKLLNYIGEHNNKYKRTDLVVNINDLQREYSSIMKEEIHNGKTLKNQLEENYSKYFNHYYKLTVERIEFDIKDFETGRDIHIENYENEIIRKLEDIKNKLEKAKEEINRRLENLANAKIKR